MKPSEILIEAIKSFEGYCPVAERCPAGVWTVGWGHTGGMRRGQSVTAPEAERLLRADADSAARAVQRLWTPCTQGQLDALTDFVFNLGPSALAGSTLLRKIRRGEPEAAIRREFARWVYAGSRRLPGLVKRRAWEAERFFQIDN